MRSDSAESPSADQSELQPTVVPVPEVIGVTDGVDGEVVDDTAGGHIRVSLWVNVRVTFPRFPGSELCKKRN